MMMKCTPLFDRVLVQRAEKDANKRSPGGLIIPEQAKSTPSYGTVVAVGRGKRTEDGKFIPLTVKVGDLVLFGRWSGSVVDEECFGPDILVIREDELLGIIEKSE